MKKISLGPSISYHRCTLWICLLALFFVAAIQAKEFGPFQGEFKSGNIYGIAAQLDDAAITKGNATWSMNFWIKPEGAVAGKTLLAGFGDGANKKQRQRYWANIDDSLRFWVGSNDIPTGQKLDSGKWQMLTAVHEKGILKLYKDGRELVSKPIGLQDSKMDIKLAPFSPWSDGGHFAGKIALFTIRDSALSESEIKRLLGAVESLDSLAFSKGAPESWKHTWVIDKNFSNYQKAGTLPKSLSSPQSPGTPKAPTTETVVKSEDRGFVLAGPWKLIEAAKAKMEGAELSVPGVPTENWMSATVPGTVLTTMVDQGIYPNPYYGLNNLTIPETLSRQDYWYRLEFNAPEVSASSQSFIQFNGINYQAEAWLNGTRLGTVKGAFIRGNFNTAGILKPGTKNVLAVKISPPPNPGYPHEQSIAGGPGKNGGAMVLDGPTFFCSEGWDWIPGIRDRNTGIWQNVELHLLGDITLGDPHVITRIQEPIGSRADVSIEVDVQNHSDTEQSGVIKASFEGVSLEKKITLPSKNIKSVRFSSAEFPQLSVTNPRLWWPNGYGKPELYHLTISLIGGKANVSDAKKVTFGMRETSVVLTAMASNQKLGRYEFHPTAAGNQEVIRHDHASLVNSVKGWVPTIADDKKGLPGLKVSDATGTEPYLEIRVNGQRIAIRGGNWGMDDAMKNISRKKLEPYIRLHRDANINLIRNWCGQSTGQDLFDLCDEYGILVFNDFWLTTENFNTEPTDNALFLANAEDTIKRFRNHPSIIIWCGRNEGVPPPELNIGLAALIRKWDGTRYYQPNSRTISLSDSGPWNYIDPKDYYKHQGFSTELGLPSILSADAIRSMIPVEDLWPLSDVWAYHDAVPSGAMDTKTYLKAIEAQYGAATDFEDFVRKTQMMNFISHRAMFEGMNASLWSPTTGRMIWMSHPSWPSMVWQIYGWDYQPNASYYGLKKGCEPVHIQMNLSDRAILATNTTTTAIPKAKITARVYDLSCRLLSTKHDTIDLPINGKTPSFTLDSVPKTGVYFVQLELHDSKGKLLSGNLYWLAENPADFNGLSQLPQVKLEANLKSLKNKINTVVNVKLVNPSKTPAMMTLLTLRKAEDNQRILPAYMDENYITLLPGEEKVVTIEAPAELSSGKLSVTLEGWNIQPQTISVP